MRALRRKQQHIKPPRRPKRHSIYEQLRKRIARRREKHSLMSRARRILASRRKRKRT